MINRACSVSRVFPFSNHGAEEGRGDRNRERERERTMTNRATRSARRYPSWLATTLPTLWNNNLSPIIGARSITHRWTLDLTRPPASLVADRSFLFTFADRARRDFFPIFIGSPRYTGQGPERIKPRLHCETFNVLNLNRGGDWLRVLCRVQWNDYLLLI